MKITMFDQVIDNKFVVITKDGLRMFIDDKLVREVPFDAPMIVTGHLVIDQMTGTILIDTHSNYICEDLLW